MVISCAVTCYDLHPASHCEASFSTAFHCGGPLKALIPGRPQAGNGKRWLKREPQLHEHGLGGLHLSLTRFLSSGQVAAGYSTETSSRKNMG